MMRFVAAALLLAGCASDHMIIRTEASLDGYTRHDFAYPTNLGSYPVAVYLRTFEDQKKLGVCAYYVHDAPPLVRDLLNENRADMRSELKLDGERVSDLSYFTEYQGLYVTAPRSANCVRTVKDWRPEYASPKVGFTIPAARAQR